MCEFKKGDLVIRTQECENYYWGLHKPDGDVFKVSGIVDSNINLEGSMNGFFPSYNFELFKSEYPNPPHKHRDAIIAWANGADIEKHNGQGWKPDPQPLFFKEYGYRVAQPKTDKERIAELEARVKELENKQSV
jgi:hypothetical protein